MRYLTARPAVWYTLLALACAGEALDMLTTALTVATGAGGEANPIGVALLARGGWLLVNGAKTTETLLLVGLTLAFARSRVMRRSRVASVALVALALLVAALFAIVGHNLALLLIIHQHLASH